MESCCRSNGTLQQIQGQSVTLLLTDVSRDIWSRTFPHKQRNKYYQKTHLYKSSTRDATKRPIHKNVKGKKLFLCSSPLPKCLNGKKGVKCILRLQLKLTLCSDIHRKSLQLHLCIQTGRNKCHHYCVPARKLRHTGCQ